MYSYKEYMKEWLGIEIQQYSEKNKSQQMKSSHIICCPEPLEFIQQFENITSVDDGVKKMEDLKKDFKKIDNFVSDNENIWFHTTKEGVNLRLGRNIDGTIDDRVRFGDDIVHGVIVGRTGAGKSVFLNHFIMTMLYEYAPWELDLYLADLKKVEFSRYMSKVHTPHLKTCAATGEIRYMLSMLQHLYDCMLARQNLLTKVGLQKLSEFREQFDVVLPRVVLVIDEFQQLYQEANSKEDAKIRSLIYRIIKLGRATGFHLIFASQEMNRALNAMEMANFKARFALSCDAEVSTAVLGNSKAADLKERGRILVNIGGRDEEKNEEYIVPYIESEENYFFENLAKLKKKAENYGFQKKQTFYQEDEQEKIEQFAEVLEKVKQTRENYIKEKKYYEVITLGHGVVYSEKKHNLEHFFMKRERDKNILAICNEIEDLAYIQKMFAMNFQSSPKQYQHIYFDFCGVLSEKYKIINDIPESILRIRTEDQWSEFKSFYDKRQELLKIVKSAKDKDDCWEKYTELFFDDWCKEQQEKEEKEKEQQSQSKDTKQVEYNQWLKAYYQSACEQGKSLGEIFPSDFSDKWKKVLEDNYKEQFEKLKKGKIEKIYNEFENNGIENIFPPIVVWLSGLDYLKEKVPRYLPELLKTGMDVNMLFLLFSSSANPEYIESTLIQHCEYLFAKGEETNIYQRLNMNFGMKSQNDIAIDFKMKSRGIEKAFKKYKVEWNDTKEDEIDFDALF